MDANAKSLDTRAVERANLQSATLHRLKLGINEYLRFATDASGINLQTNGSEESEYLLKPGGEKSRHIRISIEICG